MIDYLFNSLPLVAALFIWAIRLEVKIAKIQTDLKWIKGQGLQCQPTLEDPTN